MIGDRVAHCEHQRHPLREQASSNEGEYLRRHVVQPLSVIDEADERRLVCDVGEQAEHCEPDQKAVRRPSCAKPECRSERVTLRAGQAIKTVHLGGAQLMQAGERKLHLRLRATRA